MNILAGVIIGIGSVSMVYLKREKSVEIMQTRRKKSSEAVEDVIVEKPETATISCPTCSDQFQVPKLNKMQQVCCPGCNSSGEIKI